MRGRGPRIFMADELVLLALGSNLGDSPAVIRAAMDRIAPWSAGPLLRSSLWTSTPVDCPPGSPLFVNAAVALVPRSDETPESLLAKTQALEREFGRRPKVVLNEARPLDVDLIAWGHRRHDSPSLTLPHPRAHQRRFVLEPLAEIAAESRLPGQLGTVQQLLAGLRSDEILRRLGPA
jgi:2-amino-4-hydroxy-6-hydroxymethyldihydropteridine diphosphokinase